MNQYERRFYEDIQKLAIIQEKILKQLEKMNEPIICDKEETKIPKKIEAGISTPYVSRLSICEVKVNEIIDYLKKESE